LIRASSVGEAVIVVDGSTAVLGVSGADDDVAAKMMNSYVQMVVVDQDIDRTCSTAVVQAGTEEDETNADGVGDGPATPSTCKFFVGFEKNQDHTDGPVEQVAEDAAVNDHQGTEMEGESLSCACLGNLVDAEHEQVPKTNSCCEEEENPDFHDDQEVHGSCPKVVEVDESLLPVCVMCSNGDGDDNDDDAFGTDQFYDASDNEQEACSDTVSDSVSFEVNNDKVGEELPGSHSDSMLCRLPVRLDAVQELSDSGNEDVTTEHSADVDLLAVSPATSSPTSPASVFDHVEPEHSSSVSSPDSVSKPPSGAVISRHSLKSEPADRSPKSPDDAIVQGHKVELRPPKITAATKRVSSFRKSLIK